MERPVNSSGAMSEASRLEVRAGLQSSLARLWRYALVLSKARDAADDLVQATCLRAIERAEQFIHARPADAQAILREQLKLDQHFVDWVWGGLGFRLSLDQSLVSTMEGEVRWAQREGHVAGGARPNVLTLIHAGPLKSVKPDAVGTGG